MALPAQIVVESLLGADPPAAPASGNGTGNGSTSGNGSTNGTGRRPRAAPEVEYDDLEAPRGHVVRSKRASAILSGELQAEPVPPDRAVPMEPSIALGAGPAVMTPAAELAIGEATAEVMLLPRARGGGMIGILLGTVIVVGVAVGAWYVARATGRDDNAAASTAPAHPPLPPAPVITAVAPAPDEVANPPPPEPAPAPAPVPAKTEITIRFSSSPDGAQVRIPGAKKVLGVTPFEASFPREEGAQAFEFSKRGFDTVTGQVALDVDSALTVALSRKGRPVRRGGGGVRKPGDKPDPSLDRGGTMDVLGGD